MGTGHRLGEWGENTARVMLELCGYECLDRRFRRPGGEIDLVMRQGQTLVFVEVKTRGAGAIAPAEDFFGGHQLRRLRRMALLWLNEYPNTSAEELRFDLVAINIAGSSGGLSLQHLVGVG